jgi:hypothetical protein
MNIRLQIDCIGFYVIVIIWLLYKLYQRTKGQIHITRNSFRVFGYGLSWTKQPRFSHRMGLKGLKLFGLYWDFLKPNQ